MTTTSGSAIPDERRHHPHNPGDEGSLAKPAIRKGCVVSGVDNLNVRPQTSDFGQYRKTPES